MEKNESTFKKLFKRFTGNRILVSSSFLAFVSAFVGIINFIFNLIISNLIPEQFGIIYPLVSLLLILNIPIRAYQFVLTHDISDLIKNDKLGVLNLFFQKILRFVFYMNLGLSAIILAALPLLQNLLHIESAVPFVLLIITLIPAYLYIPYFSMIQSRERFFPTGLTQLLSALVKLGGGIGIVMVFKSNTFQSLFPWIEPYYGAILAYTIYNLGMLVLLFIDYRRFKKEKGGLLAHDEANLIKDPVWEKITPKKQLQSFFYAILAFGAFQLFTYLDPILVRHFLEAQSGVYSTVSLLGKASFYIATAFSFVLLPMMSKDKPNIRKSNLTGLALLVLVLLAYGGGLALFSGVISKYLFHGNYPGMEKVLPLYGFMFLPYAVISYLVNYYFLSRKLIYSITIIVGAVLQAIGIALFHQNLIQISLVVGVVGFLVLVVLIVDSVLVKEKPFEQKKST